MKTSPSVITKKKNVVQVTICFIYILKIESHLYKNDTRHFFQVQKIQLKT